MKLFVAIQQPINFNHDHLQLCRNWLFTILAIIKWSKYVYFFTSYINIIIKTETVCYFMYYAFLFILKLGIWYVFFYNKTTTGVLFHLGLSNSEAQLQNGVELASFTLKKKLRIILKKMYNSHGSRSYLLVESSTRVFNF